MRFFMFVLIGCLLISCSKNESVEHEQGSQNIAESESGSFSPKIFDADTLANGEPKRIEVQHILISFQGRRTKATRSQADAQLLAIEVLAKAQSGEDFDALVKEYTDDAFPGRYKMTNLGVVPDPARGREFPREQMVGAFGDVGFKLKIGEIGMANYNNRTSPYGWHIIK
ncbi:MAG: peptidylprolyl isomerase, partial [bacterium]